MKALGETLRLSATDLANHLACRHITELDRGRAEGRWNPPFRNRPEVEVLAERGRAHEKAFLAHLESMGTPVTRMSETGTIEETLEVMRSGVPAIAQATLASGRWFGRADLLLRVERPSELGAWSYEPLDTKLAQETRASAILQLCLYAHLLEATQGVMPEFMKVAPRRPEFPVEPYRVADYLAYYRLVRRRLEAALEGGGAEEPLTYPEPVPHCEICVWWPGCDKRRRKDDHLSFVAGLSRLQTRELQSREIKTLARLAAEPLPLAWKPSRGAKDGYVRVREQASIQLRGRNEGRAMHQVLDPAPGMGLARLPQPSPCDVFLDLEADPFVDDGGLEYLFGWVAAEPPPEGTLALDFGKPEYSCHWALGRMAEKRGFEASMDAILDRWHADPGMHVYHFGVYEPGALKRLMGRHATREEELDRMLRAGRFVDLHAIVKQALRASVEEYSIKKLEPLYGFVRQRKLDEAGSAQQVIQRALELGLAVSSDDEHAKIVAEYNRDDCFSTLALRDWLEALRTQAIAEGAEITRPTEETDEPSPDIKARDQRTQVLADRLLAGLPEDPSERNDEEKARALLAHLLGWHRREDKASWWEYFRLRELPDEELLDETAALSGLEFVERVSQRKPLVDRYRFPAQETKIRAGDQVRLPLPDGNTFGKVTAIDLIGCTVDVNTIEKQMDVHPTSFFEHQHCGSEEQWQSLMRLGEWVAANGVDAVGPRRAARDLVLRKPPRIVGHPGGALQVAGEGGVRAARRIGLALGETTLAIQGPPGAGKTFTGARMICDLVDAGKRVGVCAQSHKVIRNLLEAVATAAKEERVPIRIAQNVREKSETPNPRITELTENEDVLAALRGGTAFVAGGTSFMWAREDFTEAVDVLFVDEAGQMSLANVVAIAASAKNVVLLGDPQQLEQPVRGLHPEGSAASALEHVLGGGATIESHRGLFLEQTWRLPPAICAFTSEMFYESRLHPHGTIGRTVHGAGHLSGSGLFFMPVEHDANQSSSPEEVAIVVGLVADLLRGGVEWTDRDGEKHPLTLADIRVIAPYNAQVADLAANLPPGTHVGTVDRFQGQEAPIVIYSLTTSTPEDAPRGMDFLYNPNRLNVATSRAMCVCVVVGTRRLFEPDCSSPKQIKLANAFCRMLELAREVPLGAARGLELVTPGRNAGRAEVV